MSLESIDLNLARGIILILLMIGFLGIWAWAWSRKRVATFRKAAMLPLEEDFGRIPDMAEEDRRKTEGTKE